MSSKVQCYLRTLRREWGLSQEEVASLLPKGGRNRVSRVERGVAQPNAQEILAYSLIFGLTAETIFAQLSDETEEVVVRGTIRLYERLEGDSSIEASYKRKLMDQIRARALSGVQQSGTL